MRSTRACVNARDAARATCCRSAYPWCAEWEDELKRAVRAPTSRPSRQQHVLDYDDLLLYWAQMIARARAGARRSAARFDHVLVDEYQDTNRLQAAILLALKPDGARPDGGRRRRAVDLLVPRRDGAQHPRLPARSSRRPRASSRSSATTARTQPILDAANARDRRGARALHQEPLDRARLERASRSWSRCATRPTRPRSSSTACSRSARRGMRAEAAGGAVPHRRTTARRSRSSSRGATSRS